MKLVEVFLDLMNWDDLIDGFVFEKEFILMFRKRVDSVEGEMFFRFMKFVEIEVFIIVVWKGEVESELVLIVNFFDFDEVRNFFNDVILLYCLYVYNGMILLLDNFKFFWFFCYK